MKKIDRLNAYIARAVPTSYDGSSSWLEFLGNILFKINELIDVTNDYFDVDLEVYTENILNSWYESGRLETIISRVLDTELAEIRSDLDQFFIDTNNNYQIFKNEYDLTLDEHVIEMDRISGKLSKTDTIGTGNAILQFRHVHRKADRPSLFNQQGMTYNPNRNEIITANIPLYEDEGPVKLTAYNLDGTTRITRTIQNGGHANSMAWNGTHILLVPMANKKAFIIDPDTLEKIDELTFTTYVSSISFYNGKYYTMGNTTNTIDIHDENLNFIESKSIQGITEFNYGKVNQSFTIKNDKIYMVRSDPSALVIIDLKTFKIERSLDVKSNSLDYREFEDIEVLDNGDIFIAWHHGFNKIHFITGVYRLNLTSELATYHDITKYIGSGGESDSTLTIHVNNNSMNYQPDGTTEKPFYFVQEALNFINKINDKPGARIIKIVGSATPYTFFRLVGVNNLMIMGKGATFDELEVYNSNNIVLDTMNFNSQVELYFSYSNVTLRQCTTTNATDRQLWITKWSTVNWEGTTESLADSSVEVSIGSEFFANNINSNRMVIPIGLTWKSRQPITIWSGAENSGTHSFRNKIKLSSFKSLFFTLSTGDVLRINKTTGNINLRTFNMGDEPGNYSTHFTEFVVSLTETGFTIVSNKGLQLTESGNTPIDSTIVTITEISGL